VTPTFKIRCDQCGRRSSVGFKDPCPHCGANGGPLSPAALRELAKLGKNAIERMNERPRLMTFRRLDERSDDGVVRLIPARAARTAKATAASVAKRTAPVKQVMKLTVDGMSAGQIGIILGIGARHVVRLRRRGRLEAAASGEKPRT
jgi:hypothetical protein